MHCRLILVLLVFGSVISAQASPAPAAHDPTWLKIYDYRKLFNGTYRSSVTAKDFFFDQINGPIDPSAELAAAEKAFFDHTISGRMKLPAACSFPARFIVAKRILNAQWPEQRCPDVKDWLERINADSVNIVFASAFTGNPASILGHTFLRFYNSGKEKSAAALGLLSYAVGFLARTDPGDDRVSYMMKGLTGGYRGYYEIEPFYIKVGLYNNSESRDLFEHRLNLTPEEVNFILLHLWELIFNGEHRYYFLDENCSFRLLTLIETVRPQLNLSSNYTLAALPPETVRDLIDRSIAQKDFAFRSSLKRRLEIKKEIMSDEQKLVLKSAEEESWRPETTSDPLVLDALIDQWTYRNYKSNAQLSPAHQKKMNEILLRRSRILKESPTLPSDIDIARSYSLIPPYRSHRPEQWSIGVGHKEETFLQVGGQLGAHSPWQNPQGYFENSSIEYLGAKFQYTVDSERIADWQIKFADVRVLESFPQWSWQFNIYMDNKCTLCALDEKDRTFFNKGNVNEMIGAGIALPVFQSIGWLFPVAAFSTWRNDGLDSTGAIGYEIGLRRPRLRSVFNIRFRQLFVRKEYMYDVEMQFSPLQKHGLLVSYFHQNDTQNEKNNTLVLSLTFD